MVVFLEKEIESISRKGKDSSRRDGIEHTSGWI